MEYLLVDMMIFKSYATLIIYNALSIKVNLFILYRISKIMCNMQKAKRSKIIKVC